MDKILINQVQSQEILVSVIIATYRREESLEKALSSVALQTYKNNEILVIDDNANKDWNKSVSGIITSVSDKYLINIIHIVNKDNLGSAATRNRGIAEAKGEYITFLDDDDIYLPEKIEMQLQDMVRNEADYGLTDLYLYNCDGQLIDKRIRKYIKDIMPKTLLRYHLMYHMTGTDTLMFKTEYLRKIGGFPGIDVGDEFYLMKEAICAEGKCCYSPHCYVKAYVHEGDDGGLSSGEGKIKGENDLYNLKKQYFSEVKKKEIQYMKMRHYAVLAFAEMRRKGYLKFIKYLLFSFICSPIDFYKMVIERV